MQKDLLKSITLDDLLNMEEDQLNDIFDSNEAQIPFKSRVVDRTNKRMFSYNQHSNSEEYKSLGNLHREKRVIEYFPQDDRAEFSPKSKVNLERQSPDGKVIEMEKPGRAESTPLRK